MFSMIIWLLFFAIVFSTWVSTQNLFGLLVTGRGGAWWKGGTVKKILDSDPDWKSLIKNDKNMCAVAKTQKNNKTTHQRHSLRVKYTKKCVNQRPSLQNFPSAVLSWQQWQTKSSPTELNNTFSGKPTMSSLRWTKVTVKLLLWSLSMLGQRSVSTQSS